MFLHTLNLLIFPFSCCCANVAMFAVCICTFYIEIKGELCDFFEFCCFCMQLAMHMLHCILLAISLHIFNANQTPFALKLKVNYVIFWNFVVFCMQFAMHMLHCILCQYLYTFSMKIKGKCCHFFENAFFCVHIVSNCC